MDEEITIGKRLFKGSSWIFLAHVGSAVFSFFTFVFLARWLGPGSYGLVSLILTMILVLGLVADLGVGLSTSKYISEFNISDRRMTRSIIHRGFVLKLGLGIGVSFFCFIYAGTIAYFMNLPRLVPLLKIACVAVFFYSLLMFIINVFQGLHEFRLMAISIFLRGSAVLVLGLGMVLLGWKAQGAIIGYTLGYGIVFFIMGMILIVKFYGPLPRGNVFPYRKILNFSLPLGISYIAVFIYNKMDIIMIGYFVNSAEVGYYSVAHKTMEALLMPLFALGVVLIPLVTELYAKGQIDKIVSLLLDFLKYGLMFIIPMIFGLIAISRLYVTIIFGELYSCVVIIIIVLSIFLLNKTIGIMGGPYLIASNRVRIYAIYTSLAALVNFGLNLLLIPKFNALGAAVATIISHGALQISILVTIIKMMEAHIPKTIYINWVKYLISSLVMYFVIKKLNFMLFDIMGLIIMILIGLCTYSIMVLSLGGINKTEIIRFKGIFLK